MLAAAFGSNATLTSLVMFEMPRPNVLLEALLAVLAAGGGPSHHWASNASRSWGRGRRCFCRVADAQYGLDEPFLEWSSVGCERARALTEGLYVKRFFCNFPLKAAALAMWAGDVCKGSVNLTFPGANLF